MFGSSRRSAGKERPCHTCSTSEGQVNTMDWKHTTACAPPLAPATWTEPARNSQCSTMATVSCGVDDRSGWRYVLCRSDPRSHSAIRQRPGSRFFRGTGPSRRGTQRGRQAAPTEIPVTGDYFRAQPVRRGLSQPAKPARESPVQIRLASPTRNVGDRVRDSPDSLAALVQSVRTAQSRGDAAS